MSKLSRFKINGIWVDIEDSEARNNNKTNSENIERVQGDLEDEVERARNKENELASKIDTNTSNISDLEENLSAETERAKSVEETNASDLSTEIQRAKEAEKDNSDKITTNATAIATETQARTTADNSINQKIDSNEKNTVNDVELSSENGVYTLSQTKNGTKTDIGQIDTNSTNNPVVEVKDSITEDTTYEYEAHKLTETTEDGTENDISTLYIPQKGIVGMFWSDATKKLIYNTINQSGEIESHNVDIPASGVHTYTSHIVDISLQEETINGRGFISMFTHGKIPANSIISSIYIPGYTMRLFCLPDHVFQYHNEEISIYVFNITDDVINLNDTDYMRVVAITLDE